MGRNQVHELNRDHIAAGIAVALAELRPELWTRLRQELSRWHPGALYANVFGSAARGDGDESSDIDLLLVHPPFPGEKKPPRAKVPLSSQFTDVLAEFMTSNGEIEAPRQWEEQVDRLRQLVQAWTGNALQIVDVSFQDWRHPHRDSEPLFVEIEREGIELIKSRAFAIWPVSRSTRG
jgi:predicted nucleotidyltransferase